VPDNLIVVVGATGTGKSDLSLAVAEGLAARGMPAEIVNADAMQLYRGMDVGTAKLSLEERRGIPHHMLDVLDPLEEANVAKYQADARAAIERIEQSGAVPILVGGSGLYVSSVIQDFRFPGTDAEARAALEAELLVLGPGELYRRLKQLDPQAAAAIGASNGRRIVRALEVIGLTGEPFGSGLPEDSEPWRKPVTIGLRAPREQLVERLGDRVRRMWQSGLLDEVRALSCAGLGLTARRAIGYSQALAQLAGDVSENEAIEQTAALTRRYARRQVGWFNRYRDAHWIEFDASDRDSRALSLIGQD
jgi:tRNA dimethylallyltransferase